jgi:hypothetical protein
MATTSGHSGAISLNSIHVEVGEGNPTTTASIGDADIRNRMGYGSSAVSFSNFYKSWGCTITHGSATVIADKYTTAGTYSGFNKHGSLFGSPIYGSVSDESIHGSAISGNTIWIDQFYHFNASGWNWNMFYLHDGTAPQSTANGLPTSPGDTDPFRATKVSRLCWNDTSRTLLTSPAPYSGLLYWENVTMPTSGNYDIGVQWAT